MTAATSSCTSASNPDIVTDLLPRVSDGDPLAWNEVLRQYGKLVSATVRSYRLQDADAFDAVQMTWLRLAENAHQVQFPERLGGWLVTTARRECLHILRKAKSAPNLCDTEPDTITDHSMDPEQRIIDADITQTLWSVVAELPPRRRTLLQALFTDHPQPYRDIAHTTGIALGAIGPTRARALRQLRSRLHDHGLGPDTR